METLTFRAPLTTIEAIQKYDERFGADMDWAVRKLLEFGLTVQAALDEGAEIIITLKDGRVYKANEIYPELFLASGEFRESGE